MKKILVLFLSFICVFGMVSCANKSDGTTNTPKLEEVWSLSQEQLDEKLIGLSQKEIHNSWGEPGGKLSGFWGDFWYFNNTNKHIILYYDSDGNVEHIKINEQTEDLPTAKSLGIVDIVDEGIVSASFDSHIPNYIYEVKDLTVLQELLGCLNGATFEECDDPEEPLSSVEAIYITTKEHEYYLGVFNNSDFKVSIDGEGKYYTCSHKDNFLEMLLRLQDR